MYCTLCNRNDGQLHLTKCNHYFHVSCLQQVWNSKHNFCCPVCQNYLGLVLTDTKQAYIVFESSENYQCVFTVNKDAYVEPASLRLSKWERVEKRLSKRKASVLLKPVIVS
jgi:hypothetical protein